VSGILEADTTTFKKKDVLSKLGNTKQKKEHKTITNISQPMKCIFI
jgi:hypothetical protein